MLPRLMLSGLVGLLTACHVDFGDSDRFHEDFNRSFPMTPGGRLVVEGFNGTIDISTWEKNEVEINGTKLASSQELLKDIKVDFDVTSSSVKVRVDKPSFQGNCGVRFTIRVPKKVELERIRSSNGSIQVAGIEGPAALISSNGKIEVIKMTGKLNVETSNGSIELAGHRGPVHARTSNGKISGDIEKGWLDAHTSNGSIEVRLKEIDMPEPVRLETSNGSIEVTLTAAHELKARSSNSSITVRLPESIDVTLKAYTSNSRVETDFADPRRADSEDDDEKNHRRLDAKVGKGGPVIDLSTSNGKIRILKS